MCSARRTFVYSLLAADNPTVISLDRKLGEKKKKKLLQNSQPVLSTREKERKKGKEMQAQKPPGKG